MKSNTHYIKLPKYKDKYIKLWFIEYGQCNNPDCRIHGIIRQTKVRETILRNNYRKKTRSALVKIKAAPVESWHYYYKEHSSPSAGNMYYTKRKNLISAEATLAQFEERDLKLTKERIWTWKRIKHMIWRIFP